MKPLLLPDVVVVAVGLLGLLGLVNGLDGGRGREPEPLLNPPPKLLLAIELSSGKLIVEVMGRNPPPFEGLVVTGRVVTGRGVTGLLVTGLEITGRVVTGLAATNELPPPPAEQRPG